MALPLRGEKNYESQRTFFAALAATAVAGDALAIAEPTNVMGSRDGLEGLRLELDSR
jgi:hypothetical protein